MSNAVDSVGVVYIEVSNGYDLRDVLDDMKSRVDAIENLAENAEQPIYEEILIKINTSMDVFKRSFRKLTALDVFFKEKAPKPVKSDISGVKVELNGIKMAMASSQKRRNEYLSQKEEIEQLQKLGIQIQQT